jgi:hypothetical protein
MPKRKAAGQPALADNGIDKSLSYRAIPLKRAAGDQGGPATLDEATRSVEVVVSTEAPVLVFDWDRWEMVPEILLMSGCQLPDSRQIPLLDTHQRWNTSSVIGSTRDLRVEGDQLLGRAVYSSAPEAEGPYLKMREGHLTDYSVGYRYANKDCIYVPEGQTAAIDGRTFTGPVKVVRQWAPMENSTCPIGADEFAKARAATAAPSPHKEQQNMDEKLRAFLESRGLAKDATEEEAWRHLETLNVRSEETAVPGAPADAPTLDTAVRTAVRAEQERMIEIRAIAGRAGLDETKINEMIVAGKSVEEVRAAAFDHITSSTPASPGFRATVVADERDKFRSAAQDSLLLRAGRSLEKPAPGATDLRGFSLREIARESLRVAGQPVGGDVMQMVGRALTTSDFPILLGNTANLSLLAGWEGAMETWEQWCGIGSLSDFNIHTLARAGETDDLDEVGEDDEYKYGKLAETSEQVKLTTFGKLNKISRQAIINDDLGAITDAFIRRGEAAARKVGDLPYAVLVANANMGDGVALFHATHANLAVAAAITVDTLALAEDFMVSQKDVSGKSRLNIRPQFLLAPSNKRILATQVINGAVVGTQAAPGVINPYQGQIAVIGESRLKDDSATAWYLAGPKGKTVVVYFLNGNRTPYLETREGWTTDGVEFKTRIDAAAKAVDFRGLVKNPGL